MNIEEINEYHDAIANTRKLLGDVHTGDASRAQASLAAFVTYATRSMILFSKSLLINIKSSTNLIILIPKHA